MCDIVKLNFRIRRSTLKKMRKVHGEKYPDHEKSRQVMMQDVINEFLTTERKFRGCEGDCHDEVERKLFEDFDKLMADLDES